ncbi:acetyl-CoA C-acyltransferase [Laribacter hongkongensis]|uniref:acetyl-CoA C-acyltransferase n=1 Tax=Laribacter hongkongensis TaxID=168471 RepID=A0ABD4SPM6_9NEIS|nr:acetyl-CoA C-acyltransferase [Laribacter hongkongensis]MCG9025238.1 acetyl-CoA C-acyltransferase [Laribacter hongkongensis]MCG9099894.1 acetyl-CoA C-acyltransferase [Laribacter hongkongensis]MCG9103304.1 acetyl-CoA C-acyltransferase [Laribacter hongkongensis]MCG9111372.1 acetyl-CoA C-acyltransferase [Laribacter hongkongensis]MCG9119149.1 acetyl-CoA C-acyltransferase [Laribacter hongkongensis]
MTKQIQEAYIVATTRTPVGKAPRGMMRNVRPDDMLAHVIKGALAQVPDLDVNLINDVVVGCAFPEAEQGLNMARIGVLLAGLPDTVGGITINRYCSSGINAVQIAADRIRMGEADVVIAAGSESMSMVPMMGNKVSLNPEVFASDENYAIAYGMGLTAEKVAQQWKVSREDQDAFAVESHRRALAAIEGGKFAAEITPLDVTYRVPNLKTGEVDYVKKTLTTDEGPRAGTTMEGLAKLKTVFDAKGSVTAGNSSQMSDGAGAVVLVSEKVLKQFGLTPLARYVSFAVKGVPPAIMGIGPKVAIPAALENAGIAQNDIKWMELNEAFAAQALAVMRDLELDPSVVNPNGGAIALGHPLGATGAIRTATLVHGMRQAGQKGYGMVTMCIGTGMGAAGIIEVL